MLRRFILCIATLAFSLNSHATSLQYKKVEPFTRVDIQGQINVQMHTGYKTSQLLLRGDPRDLAYVQTRISNGSLYVTLGAGYPHFGPISADIRTASLGIFNYRGAGLVKGWINSRFLIMSIANPGRTIFNGYLSLRTLNVTGPGFVSIDGLNSPYLEMNLIGQPTVKLTGFANVAALNLRGAPKLSLYWVKSNNMIINAKGNSFIQLAGVANRLEIELWGAAHFDGRYLRSREVFARTHQWAVADIATTEVQHTLARDHSDIHFYNLPIMRTDFMDKSGAVLDMRDLNPPYVQEYGPMAKTIY